MCLWLIFDYDSCLAMIIFFDYDKIFFIVENKFKIL